MAEHLLRHLVSEVERSAEFLVRSAGVSAFPNDPAADQAIQVMKDKGIVSIQEHQATPVNDELVQDADLILTMTRSHKGRLLALYPQLEEKIFTLKEYTYDPKKDGESAPNLDIADPFGMPVEVYKICARELEIHLKRLLAKL